VVETSSRVSDQRQDLMRVRAAHAQYHCLHYADARRGSMSSEKREYIA